MVKSAYDGKLEKTSAGWQAEYKGRHGEATSEVLATRAEADTWLTIRRNSVICKGLDGRATRHRGK